MLNILYLWPQTTESNPRQKVSPSQTPPKITDVIGEISSATLIRPTLQCQPMGGRRYL